MSNLIKWSGSKDSQSKIILSYFPKEIENYYEPFLGGGSIFLSLLESDIKVDKYCLSDINKELIGIYEMINNEPAKIIKSYREHYKEFNSKDIQHRKDYFNEIRAKFNLEKKSEDFYWIMRVCTNGAPRYNHKGIFNQSPHFSRPGMYIDDVEKLITKYNNLFNQNNIEFKHLNYAETTPSGNDILYCDPPYQNTKGMYFGGFNNKDFIEWLNKIKCKWILSYDGKINENKVDHISPCYVRHEYLLSGNSSFRRVIGKSNNSIISESLYLNF